MSKRVLVWGTGNVGRPAIRAVLSHHDLALAGVIVSNPAKRGRDAGEIAGVAKTGVLATQDSRALLAQGVDAVVYTASADTRPAEALQDLLACLRAGANVVSTSFYALLYPPTTPPELLEQVQDACREGGSSLFVSGIDPGWALDILPLLLSGVVSDIREVRCQEIFNYALYDQPEVVRKVIGFGEPMDRLPIMLHDFALKMVWEPMVRLLGDGLGRPVDAVESFVERRPLARTVQVPGMGRFDEGTQGAFRFEVRGLCQGRALYVVEHITRIDDACAPDWPHPTEGRGCHRVRISGSPELHVSIHGEDSCEPGPAGGGNATAASRIVNSIPAVCAAKPGVLTPLDLPPITGAGQLRR
ncbi:MAG TPA: dihydrodipicolinate reductase [Myxococcota bacterium]|jgi:hypothetical protein